MKALITLFALISVSVFAQKGQVNAQELYDALGVPAVPMMSIATHSALEKFIAGISCVKSTNTLNKTTKYNCQYEAASFNSYALYNALNVQPTKSAGNIGVINFTKAVSGLTCVERVKVNNPNGLSARPGYSCKLKVIYEF